MSKKPRPYTGSYVAHICKKCGCMFIAEDYTKATALPPTWRYCKSCCEKMGIDYNQQTPYRNRTPEERQKAKEKAERLKQAREIKNQNK